MDSLHSIMPKHKKGKHLSLEERVIIQTRIKDGFSLRAIAREIGCSSSTISYEIKRGTVCFITVNKSGTKQNVEMKFIRLTDATVVANQTS